MDAKVVVHRSPGRSAWCCQHDALGVAIMPGLTLGLLVGVALSIFTFLDTGDRYLY